VTIEVTGDNVKAWLDNDLVFDTQLKRNTAEGIFSSATLDETTGEMIVKVTNTSSVSTTARIDLKNFTAQSARVIRLAAASGMDENTLQTPTHIYPVETSLSPADGSVLVDVPAYSLNIVRVK
jgi:alpha-L-arabinofuranosidase